MIRFNIAAAFIVGLIVGCGGKTEEPKKSSGPAEVPVAAKESKDKKQAEVKPIDGAMGDDFEDFSTVLSEPTLSEKAKSLLDGGKNAVWTEAGEIVEAENVDEKSIDPTVAADHCLISYVNCNDKKTYIVKLNKGDTFVYNHWTGTKCVHKTYKCR